MSKLHVARHHLHVDRHRLHQAEHEHTKDAHHLRHEQRELGHDERGVHHDRRVNAKLHRELHHDERVLDRGRAKVDRLRSSEQNALTPLQQQQSLLAQQYQDSFDPATGQGDPTVLGQLQSVNQSITNAQTSYGAKIDAAQSTVDQDKNHTGHDRDRIKNKRQEIKHDRRDIKHDRRNIHHERHELTHDRNRIHHLHHEVKRDERAVQAAKSVPNVVGGQVGKWIAEAQTILKHHGIPLTKMNARDINLIIQHESSGNPNAQNNTDSNAAAGHPSIGLMQTIGPTFDAYNLPGHDNIRNPVDNIIAGVRYAISRYGSISNVPGVRAVHAGGAYVGY